MLLLSKKSIYSYYGNISMGGKQYKDRVDGEYVFGDWIAVEMHCINELYVEKIIC